MSHSQTSQVCAIRLDDLTALNDEIAALVRAGVPLEQGLGRLGDDMPGRLGAVTGQIASRLEQGQSLGEVLADPALGVPPLYRVVVEAGIRSGRLAGALESIARSARWVSECRRMVMGAALYPMLLFLIAWGSFVWFVLRIAPVVAQGMKDFNAVGQDLFAVIAGLGPTVAYWGPGVPVVVLLLGGIWWYRSAGANLLETRRSSLLLGWLPWLGRMFRWLRVAVFAEILALLVDNEVPLDQAVTLAADSSADPRMKAAAGRLAEAIRRGESAADVNWAGSDCPPLVCWLMAAGQERGVLLAALRQTVEVYRRRAMRQADFARLYVPVALTVLVGGGLTFLHALAVFGPWVSLMHALFVMR